MLPRAFLRPLPVALVLVLSVPAALAQGSDPAPGQWGQKAPLIEPNSEFTLASTGGKIYVLGGYPAGRVSVKTVQVYDIAADSWTRGPDLPEVNNHGIAAAHDGVIYLFGGQTDPNTAYVDTVYALDTKQGANATWVPKASMPTKRSAGAAVVYQDKIYVVGGRPPRGHDFAVYDPKADRWETLPDLPSQRNHIAAELICRKGACVRRPPRRRLPERQDRGPRGLRSGDAALVGRRADAEAEERHQQRHRLRMRACLGRRGAGGRLPRPRLL